MEPDLAVTDTFVIPAAELNWRFSRASGPGGQGVNTTDSRVDLRWDAAGSAVLAEPVRERALQRLAARSVDGVVVVTASEHRSQRRNRAAARDRLAALIRAAIAPTPPQRRPTRPSAAARRRRVEDKRRRSQLKRLRRPGEP